MKLSRRQFVGGVIAAPVAAKLAAVEAVAAPVSEAAPAMTYGDLLPQLSKWVVEYTRMVGLELDIPAAIILATGDAHLTAPATPS